MTPDLSEMVFLDYDFIRTSVVYVVRVEAVHRLDRTVKNATSLYARLAFDDVSRHSVTEGPQSFI
jgi:hypothetical protein